MRGKKGKKPRREARTQGRDDDGDEALAVDPARKGPRAAPRGLSVFDDMLKKSCPYHKTLVNHTLEQCDMLKKYYSRATAKDGVAKNGGDGDAGGFPMVENVFLIFGGPTVDMSNSQRKRERHEVLAAEKAPPPSSTGRGTPSPSVAKITRTASPIRASTRWSSTQSSAMRGFPRC
jgi:hypothetical protein